MKKASEVIACVVDQGYYCSLAEHLALTYKHCYYSTPCDREFMGVVDCIYGDGLENVERTDSFLDPKILDEIDLFIFPEIGFAPLQKHLRAIGKPVWGSFDGTYLEVFRGQFIDFVKDIGLPVAPSTKITGMSNLRSFLKDKKDVYVKVDRLRGDMETWHWIDQTHCDQKLDELSVKFGGVKELIQFVIQEKIEAIAEIGFDGWAIDGKYAGSSFAGYEKKNQLYLGSLRKYDQLPKQIRDVNSAMAPTLKKLGYRNFIATELRVTEDGTPFYIDKTARLPGQTGEQLQETCKNLADVIWHGANGQVLEPEWRAKFSASATIHYDGGGPDDWKVLTVPKDIKNLVKPAHYCEVDGALHFPPCGSTELGVVIGFGNSIPETFARLKKAVDGLSDGNAVSFQLDGFFDLLDDIKEAQKQGMKFTDDPLPTKEQILKFTL